MTTKLIIVRHGNTFGKGDTPTRVGARTDLDLVESHRGSSVGNYLKDSNQIPHTVYSGPLKRHKQTAKQAIDAMGTDHELIINDDFNEIDYGPDENKPEEDVIARLGQEAIDAWNKDTTVPNGWDVDPQAIIQSWLDFADMVKEKHKSETTALFSSNGTIRFAPHITEDFDKFCNEHDIKVSTGGVCIFELNETTNKWECTNWGLKPYKDYPQN